jgi:hypothetical protein
VNEYGSSQAPAQKPARDDAFTFDEARAACCRAQFFAVQLASAITCQISQLDARVLVDNAERFREPIGIAVVGCSVWFARLPFPGFRPLIP